MPAIIANTKADMLASFPDPFPPVTAVEPDLEDLNRVLIHMLSCAGSIDMDIS